MSILELFCDVDDFCQRLARAENAKLLGVGRKRGPTPRLSMSQVMTILIHFHQSHYRDFRAYYRQHVCTHLRSEFPGLVSYTRFVELIPAALNPLGYYLLSRFGQTRGVAFIDSTPIPVCHNRRIARNRVFASMAARGKSSMGWFYGFKPHLIVNDQGALLSFGLTPGNVDDRKPAPQMAERLWRKLVGDCGYISQPLFEQLFARGVQLITPLRKNMRNRLVVLADRLLTRKRSLIETINEQLKNVSQIVHTRHRSPINFLVNLTAGLIAYTWQDKKPSIHLSHKDIPLLPAVI